ncbi:MAG: hypothetical protein P1U77_14855 [Rubripirellula sp.]|jgi:hypothetical protein|nr:hypothetical protein [Rubripirellula sp.]
MSESDRAGVPGWFWLVAGIALLWNLMGCGVLLSEVFAKEAMMESFTEAQKEWSRSTPTWIYLVFAISVITGIAGGVSLLMRKRLAIPLFAISCIAVIIQMTYTMLIDRGLQVMGPSGAVMPVLVVILSIVWFQFARIGKVKKWLV